ncbi:exopolysaccharide biosynthesis protein [Frigidibacter sp. MR17.24]|uniref:exopolysaccharide biosynthesis protein n=1 Tax=Frigidibacter sp. MR17.24 TaxID=3127345 RepID=UPI0030130BC3
MPDPSPPEPVPARADRRADRPSDRPGVRGEDGAESCAADRPGAGPDALPDDGDPREGGDAPEGLGGVLDRLRGLGGEHSVSIGRVMDRLGTASFTPALVVPAVIVVSPLSGIPLLSSVCGLTIALIAGQMLIGKRALWLPGVLRRRAVPGARLATALRWLDRPARFIDRWTGRRLGLLVHAPFSWLLLLACFLCGAVMPMLELVPFSSSILGSAVSLMALALLIGDGLLALLGLAAIGGAVTLGLNLLVA